MFVMLKNKYVFWIGLGVWVLLLAGSGLWFWHSQHPSTAKQLSAADTAGTNGQSATTQSGQQTNTITPVQTATPNQTISGGGSGTGTGNVAGDSTNKASSSDVSKLLDPKTFGQYDKYKNDQSAYFIDLTPGDGTALGNNQKAAVYYRGWLTNGTLFDESKAGSDGKLQPFVFTEGAHQVITGWEQALAGMKAGGVRLVIVPPSVGYGASGQGTIPPNSVLVFQVQLAAVQ